MKLFIGIKADENSLNAIADFKNKNQYLTGLQWIKKDQWHITLLYLGESTRFSIPKIERVLQQLCDSNQSFNLFFDSYGFMPSKKPYLIWAKYYYNENFNRLKTAILKGLNLKIAAPKKTIPHITLAGLKKEVKFYKPNFEAIRESQDIEINKICLFQTYKSSDKKFNTIAEFNLKKV